MKKFAAIVLAAVLSFGCAAPAFAAGPHHGAGRCLNYAEICQGVAQKVLTPGLQSLNERLSAVLDLCALPPVAGFQESAAQNGGQRIDTSGTSPSLCARGACGLYLDENGDGICDYHGATCTNMGGGNYVDADGDGICDNYGSNCQGVGNGAVAGAGTGAGAGAGAGTGYGSHHGGAHQGASRR